jgi:hypothetical protein
MFPAHPWMHVMMETHAWSCAHVCVTEQHLDMTQLAHDAVVNAIPHAAVMPPPLLPPPLLPLPPPPLPPPLDPLPPPVDRHDVLQLCWMQLFIPCADERHDALTVTLEMQACEL